ncbi:MAG: hypothetical protein RLZZ511_1638 [Cyanobacteriota bacterium]|jgi:chemotaxis family two-component system sensor histidine kinase/response regulator PixL
MPSFDSEIHDQAYQFFIQESVEFLQILETGLMDLTEDHTVPKIHELMRAAHSIKGGAASVGLNSIKQLAYQLEDCLRALYQDTVVVDRELEDLLLQAFDCLQGPLQQQIETGEHDEEAATAAAEPVFVALVERLGEALEQVNTAMPTSAELGIDIVAAIFAGDVQNGIQRIEQVLSHPNPHELVGEIRAQAEVFVGVGELVNLPGWVAIAKAILAALQESPATAREIAAIALVDLTAAAAAVLAGDRSQGGTPSDALLAYSHGATVNASIPSANHPSIPTIAASEIDDAFAAVIAEDDPIDFDWLAVDPDGEPYSGEPYSGEPYSGEPDRGELDNVPIDELANAAQIASATTIFEANSEVPIDFDSIPTAQLDELFALAMDPADLFLAADDSMPHAVHHPVDDSIHDCNDVTVMPPDDDLAAASLKTMTASIPAADNPGMLNAAIISDDDFANLDAFFDLALDPDGFDLTEAAPIPVVIPPTVDALPPLVLPPLSDRFTPVEPPLAQALPTDCTIAQTIQTLLENADRGVYQGSAAPPNPNKQVNRSRIAKPTEKATSSKTTNSKATNSNHVVRVDLARLEQISNRVGTMVTQENTTRLHNQQLQATAQAMLQRFSQFEAVAKQIGNWSDQSQKLRAKLTRQQAAAAQAPATPAPATPVQSLGNSWEADFDPLQMDTYSELYGFAQEMLELMAQMGEGMTDINQLSQQAVRSQTQQQQLLKQLRDDLQWARMLPLDDLLQRFPRMMRDLSSRYGKPVKLELSGTNTLVDKSILQSLYDPLVHLLRNAFDHGIELPEERIAQGKAAQATIAVRAFHRGNQTYIEISDDGRGIDPDRLRQKVVEKGLVSASQAAKLKPQELYSYLFAPGFSTADQVSELSGRGVGLDAVKSQILGLKGNVSLSSSVGAGSTFTLQLPLTLSVASLLVFSIQSCMMALPIDALKAIVVVPKRQIQLQQGRKVYHWDEQAVPLCPRSQFLQSYPLPRQLPVSLKPIPLPDQDTTTLLLVEAADRQLIALAADQILQEQELAIKPFGSAIAPPPYFYGCTILGNGLLVPVLDAQALLQPELILPAPSLKPSDSAEAIRDRSTMTGIAVDRTPVILVVDDSLTTRQSLALTLQKAGYRTIQAKDGREGLEQLAREPDIKAVFSDVEMPRMNGFEFLSQCRQQYTKEQLPVIMLTSRGGDKHRQIAQYMGANDYLTKPYLAVDVLRSLEAVLPKAITPA